MALYNFVIYKKTDFSEVDFNGDITTNSVITPIYITIEDNDSWLGGTVAPANDTNGQQTIASSSDPSLVGLGIELHHPGGANTHTLVQAGAQDLRILDVSIDGSPDYVLGLVDNVNAELSPSTTYTDNDPTRGQFGLLYSASSMPCFVEGTRIATSHGQVPVEALRVGDLVRTADHGDQAIRWIGSRLVSSLELCVNSKLRPIRIAAGAMGEGQPERDLLVSRQHRLLVRSKIALRMFGVREVLVPAVKLVGLPGVDLCPAQNGMRYFHFLCDSHEIVFAEDCPTETLFLGPETLRMMSAKSGDEILEEFFEVGRTQMKSSTVRPIIQGKATKRLVERHVKNARPPVELPLH